jgi:hypothetical protein
MTYSEHFQNRSTSYFSWIADMDEAMGRRTGGGLLVTKAGSILVFREEIEPAPQGYFLLYPPWM